MYYTTWRWKTKKNVHPDRICGVGVVWPDLTSRGDRPVDRSETSITRGIQKKKKHVRRALSYYYIPVYACKICRYDIACYSIRPGDIVLTAQRTVQCIGVCRNCANTSIIIILHNAYHISISNASQTVNALIFTPIP